MTKKILRVAIPLLLMVAMSLLLVKVDLFRESFLSNLAMGLIIFVSAIEVIEAIQVLFFEKQDANFKLDSIGRKNVVFNKRNKHGIHGVDDDGKVCFIRYQFRKLIPMDTIWECEIIEDLPTYTFVLPIKQLK